MIVRQRLSLILFCACILCGVAGTSYSESHAQINFWIAANGSDKGSGSEKEPFATISRSLDAVREVIRSKPGANIVVTLRGGTYRLDQPITFTPEESGHTGGSITYVAKSGEKPIIVGSRRIIGFQPAGNGLWKAMIPEVRDGRWNFEQLYVNGRRAVRARTPNNNYFYMNGTMSKPGQLSDHVFDAEKIDIKPLLSKSPEALHSVIVVGYHAWDISRNYISSIDAARGSVYLKGLYPPKFFSHTAKERYYLENYREALDEPGEWYLDRDGTLLYVPRAGEDMKNAVVEAPVIDTFMQFNGASRERPVENITIQGISFAYTQYRLPLEGQWSPQAASEIKAAILVDYAKNIKFLDCAIEHTGTYAIWFRNGCQNNVVQECYFNDLGAGGIRVGQTGPIPADRELTHHITIDNNIIRNGGRVWPDAVGILIGHSGDNQVTHNDISGLPYTGISVGWKWGYGTVPSVRNAIRFNHVHHLGRDILYDMGGIYTLGEAPGTVISDNVIHDLEDEDGFGMSGLYNDNSSSYILMERNLVYRVLDGFAYQQTSGKEDILRNNILVSEKGNLLNLAYFYDREDQVSINIESNILYGKWFMPFSPKKIGNRAMFRNNLYWDPFRTSADLEATERTITARQKDGHDLDAVIADPGFEDLSRYNFTLKTESAAKRIGFKPFNYNQAGVYGSADWVNKAKEVQYGFYQRRPVMSWTFFDDFENTPVGSVPDRLSLSTENKGDSILVSDEAAAGGRQSLKVTKVPGLQHAFNPHFYFNPRQSYGTAKLSFDIRIEEATQMICEWRQYPGRPYYIGPQISIKNGVLSALGKSLMSVPYRKWFHVEMSAGQGNRADGTWNLAITLPDDQTRYFKRLKLGNPDTKITNWIGFVSGASDNSIFYVDNLQMANSEIN